MIQNFKEVLEILDKTGGNKYVVLIGSWAEYLYEECNVISGFISNIKTKDIDFLIENINKPRNEIDIIKAFREHNFEIEMAANEIYRIIKGDFEVEFLAAMIGGVYSYIKVPAFKLPHVEALTHIDMLLIDPVEINYSDIEIRVPNPYIYILHKMVINKRRKEKKEKDARAIANLLIHLDNIADEDRLMYYYNKLSKKEKRLIVEYVTDNNLVGYFPRLK